MAHINVRVVVSELKKQRRAIDRAITALEAIERSHPGEKETGVRRRSKPSVAEIENGTIGRVVPFLLKQRRS